MHTDNHIPSHPEVELIAQSLGISRSIIRFWEEEFALSERANGTMSPREVAEIRLIHHLISDKELSLEEAKVEFVSKHHTIKERFDMLERLENIKKGLIELREKL